MNSSGMKSQGSFFLPIKKRTEKENFHSINKQLTCDDRDQLFLLNVCARVCVCVSTFQFYLMYTIDNR